MEKLTKEDCDNLLVILDIAAGRGLFKPESFIPIGNLYNKLIILKNSEIDQVKNEN